MTNDDNTDAKAPGIDQDRRSITQATSPPSNTNKAQKGTREAFLTDIAANPNDELELAC